MKKLFLLFTLLVLPLVASADQSGKCGDNVTYTYVSATNTLTISGTGAMANYYPSSDTPWYSYRSSIKTLIIGNGVTSIGQNAFNNCSALTDFSIPNSVTSIGSYAFYGTGWYNSQANGILYFDNWLLGYKGNGPKGELVIREGTKGIENSAFRDCTGLTSVTIPNSVIRIGQYAFYGCSALASIAIPNSVWSIGGQAFYGCTGLTSVTIPNSVKSIGTEVFRNCSGLTSVTIPNSVTSIGTEVFRNCSGLTSVTIPNSVTSIGERAFYGCSSLTSVVIGSGVTSIGYEAFSSTNLKKTIWLTNTPPSGYSYASRTMNYVSSDQFNISNKVVYKFLSSYFEVDGIRYVPVSPSERTCAAIDCVYDETATITNIPSEVTYNGITLNVQKVQPYTCYANKYIQTLNCDFSNDIPNYAFYGCTNMKSMTLANGITSIGDYAFYGCSSLLSVKFPDATTTLNQYSFAGCSSLSQIVIPKTLKTIKNYVFQGCKGVKKLTITDREDELKLGSNGSSPLFADCPLESVYIGGDISYNTSSSYGYSPFYRNTTLKTVEITDRETEISAYEFYGCTSLQNFKVGDGVTKFGDWAFSGCSSLKRISFGTQLKTIGKEAFSDCSSVTAIMSNAPEPPACGSQAMDDFNKWTCKLYVPTGSLAAYQAADQWKEFFYIQEGAWEGDLNSKNDLNGDGEVDVTDLVGLIDLVLSGTYDPTADLNGDGEVNVTDIVILINAILSEGKVRSMETATVTDAHDWVSLDAMGSNGFGLSLHNEARYVAAQMDIVLTEGQALKDVILNDSRCGNHYLSYKQAGENTYRVLVISLTNDGFDGTEGSLLSFSVEGGTGDFRVENIFMVGADAKQRSFDSLYGQTTGIGATLNDKGQMINDNWYDLYGHKLDGQPMKKGVYIRNGKKYVNR